jgi:hypothetical protein
MPGHSKWSEIKRQKGLTKTRDLARQASLRMIARGERPTYRPQIEPDGDLFFVRIPELDNRYAGTGSRRTLRYGPGLHRNVARGRRPLVRR